VTNDSGHEQRRAISDAAEKCSDTVNRAMLVLLATSFFCLVTAIGASDRSLLAPEASIKIPFAETNISFISFLAVAPLLIVVLTIYLHIFYGRWRGLDAERQAHGLFESSPALFSINRWAPRLLTAFTFYWLAPVVLAIITWKASARLEWSLPIALMTGLVIAGLILSRIFPLASSKWQRMRAISLGLIGVLAVALPITVGILAFLDEEKHDSWERGLYLFRTDLKDVWLKKARLHSADLSFAVLTGANLNYSKLKGARLTEANLTQAKLLSVDLRGAFSPSAILNDADLTWADLTRATLTGGEFYRGESHPRHPRGGDPLRGGPHRSESHRGEPDQGAPPRGKPHRREAHRSEPQMDGPPRCPRT
jgi:hypothetical protein